MSESVVLLASCGKRKSDVPCAAKDMYNSERFQKLKTIAESNGLSWCIMSAKYGLLFPNDYIDPYDLCIADCSEEYCRKWANEIVKKISTYGEDATIVVVANADYSRYVVPLLIGAGYKVSAPFIEKPEEYVSNYIKKANYFSDVMKLYECVNAVAKAAGGSRLFKDCNGKMYWPDRGVYFIIDYNERSLVSDKYPRIVRVGTHAVSKNSKSTLWKRLKTHKGTNDGGGNHRGSIFRLHVGNSIIKEQGLVCDTWGIGQSATRDIRNDEFEIERLVSEYIGGLGVVVLDVNDTPSAQSMRAYIEKNSIALLSSINSSFNFQTLNWLGNKSPRREIIESGLWNINYIASQYDESFIHVFEQFVNLTIDSFRKYEG